MLDGEQDPEMKDFFRHAAAEADARAEALREEIRILMLPKDPRTRKNVIVEIRGGAGGGGGGAVCREPRGGCTGCTPKRWAGRSR